MMKKLLAGTLSMFLILVSAGVVKAEINSFTPSTNADNLTKGWAHVNVLDKGVDEITLEFVSTRNFYSCFEYRADGDTGEKIGNTNYNPEVTDGLYPYVCVKNQTKTLVLSADEYVEVRMVFGAEKDERFDWTRFDLLRQPEKVVGGAETITAGGTTFSLAVNAVYTGKNNDMLKGKIQYSRDGLKFHAESKCALVNAEGNVATVAGPITKVQEGTIADNTWVYVAIQEGGTGSGDRVRVLLLSEEVALKSCQNPAGENLFPGLVEKGEFKIML